MNKFFTITLDRELSHEAENCLNNVEVGILTHRGIHKTLGVPLELGRIYKERDRLCAEIAFLYKAYPEGSVLHTEMWKLLHRAESRPNLWSMAKIERGLNMITFDGFFDTSKFHPQYD